MDEHTRACLQAILDGKQMQKTYKLHDAWLWEDCSPERVFLTFAQGFPENIRIKPQPMCELAGVQFPVPMQEAPKYWEVVWAATASGSPIKCHWDGSSVYGTLLTSHLLHATEIAAAAHSQAMLAANKAAVEKALQS